MPNPFAGYIPPTQQAAQPRPPTLGPQGQLPPAAPGGGPPGALPDQAQGVSNNGPSDNSTPQPPGGPPVVPPAFGGPGSLASLPSTFPGQGVPFQGGGFQPPGQPQAAGFQGFQWTPQGFQWSPLGLFAQNGG